MLRPVSTTSVEKSILGLFYCFFLALASILTARFNRRSIKEKKNALFHARSGNGPLFDSVQSFFISATCRTKYLHQRNYTTKKGTCNKTKQRCNIQKLNKLH